MEHKVCAQSSDLGITARGRQKHVVTTVGSCDRESIPVPGWALSTPSFHGAQESSSQHSPQQQKTLSLVESISIYSFPQNPNQLKGLNFLLSLLHFSCHQIAQNSYFWAQGWTKSLPENLRTSRSFDQAGNVVFSKLLCHCYQNISFFFCTQQTYQYRLKCFSGSSSGVLNSRETEYALC